MNYISDTSFYRELSNINITFIYQIINNSIYLCIKISEKFLKKLNYFSNNFENIYKCIYPDIQKCRHTIKLFNQKLEKSPKSNQNYNSSIHT